MTQVKEGLHLISHVVHLVTLIGCQDCGPNPVVTSLNC